MNSIKLLEPEGQKHKRPDLLAVICILSFIGSGLAAFSNLMIALSYDSIDEIIHSSGIDIPGMAEILAGGRSFFAISFIMYTISFTGVYNMWKLNRIGFHLYTISQIIIIILPSIFIPELDFPIVGLMFTAMFVVLFAANLRYMS